MYRNIFGRIIAPFLIFATLGALQKPVFLWLHGALSATPLTASDFLDAIVHGLPMDFTVAGYLTIVPALMAIAMVWSHASAWRTAVKIYDIFASVLLAAVSMLNLGLYGHWGFPLDTTPFFYLLSSPSAAMASVTPSDWALGALWMVLFASASYFSLRASARLFTPATGRRVGPTVCGVLLTASLFIPIRGGFTVSTMNLSRSYYSQNQLLNHAAVNPLFSLLYSAAHQNDFGSQFRYFDQAEAELIFNELKSAPGTPADTVLTTRRPDIYLIILESFSAHLLPSMGGEPIATGLDSIAREGLTFTNLYASSFRTDRALPAIIGGFPAQPTTSIMKFTDKPARLPSLPRSLKNAGWEISYYYGGDINFTNMMAYLVNCGFENIVRDTDFPLSERTGKWGAHDHTLFNRCLADIAATGANAPPQLRVIQTSSSHEPFEVPFKSGHQAKEANAFAYTDSVVTAFVNSLKADGRYDRSLIVMIPDHYGAWPADLTGQAPRHHVPLIMTGGALARRATSIGFPASQTDIAATLLGQLGIDHSQFGFSNDLFSDRNNRYAFFTDRNFATIVDENGISSLDLATGLFETPEAADSCEALRRNRVKAYLQVLYSAIDSL